MLNTTTNNMSYLRQKITDEETQSTAELQTK